MFSIYLLFILVLFFLFFPFLFFVWSRLKPYWDKFWVIFQSESQRPFLQGGNHQIDTCPGHMSPPQWEGRLVRDTNRLSLFFRLQSAGCCVSPLTPDFKFSSRARLQLFFFFCLWSRARSHTNCAGVDTWDWDIEEWDQWCVNFYLFINFSLTETARRLEWWAPERFVDFVFWCAIEVSEWRN